MRSDSSPPPDSLRSDPQSKRARILLPIALVVAALVVFLVVFWPPDHGKKGARGHSGTRSGQGPGGSSGKQDGSSPIGGGPSRPSSAKSEGWWYRDKEPKPEKSDGGWWYKDKPEGSGSKKEDAVEDSRSPVGGQ